MYIDPKKKENPVYISQDRGSKVLVFTFETTVNYQMYLKVQISKKERLVTKIDQQTVKHIVHYKAH